MNAVSSEISLSLNELCPMNRYLCQISPIYVNFAHFANNAHFANYATGKIGRNGRNWRKWAKTGANNGLLDRISLNEALSKWL